MKRTKLFCKPLGLMILLMAMFMPQMAWAETFISEVAVSCDKNEGTCKGALTKNGYTVVGTDLNSGCGSGSYYIFVGYKTTENPAEAITDLIITWEYNPGEFTWTHTGKTYRRAANVLENGNLNRGESKGANLWLYYSKTGNTTVGESLVTNIYGHIGSSSNSEYLVGVKGENGSPSANMDLNKGLSGTAYIYLGQKKEHKHVKDHQSTAELTHNYSCTCGPLVTNERHQNVNGKCSVCSQDLSDWTFFYKTDSGNKLPEKFEYRQTGANLLSHNYVDKQGYVNYDGPITNMPDGLFDGSEITGTFRIPTTVTNIEDRVFQGCEYLTGRLEIPNSVTAIGKQVFASCKGLTEVSLPNSIKVLNNHIFHYCRNLQGEIVIPISVENIKKYAFASCENVTGFVIGGGTNEIEYEAFESCSRLKYALFMGDKPGSISTISFNKCGDITFYVKDISQWDTATNYGANSVTYKTWKDYCEEVKGEHDVEGCVCKFCGIHVGLQHEEKQAATCADLGCEEYWECEECGRLFKDENGFVETTLEELEIPMLSTHDDVHCNEEIPATCTEPGQIEYWECHTCGKNFTDEACTQEVSLDDVETPAKGHIHVQHFDEIPPTCRLKGQIECWMCNDCGTYFTDEECTEEVDDESILEIAMSDVHTNLEHIEAKPATCTGTGWKEHWECRVCGRDFLDEACTQETTEEELETTEPVVHADLHGRGAEPATCKNSGYKEYWLCWACDRYFWDEACTQETTWEDIYIAKSDVHTNLAHIEAKPATCEDNGYKEHWECSYCYRLFLDEACTQETTEEELEITTGPRVHANFRYIEAYPVNCAGSWCKEHWECWACDRIFLDEACTQEITYEELEITTGPVVHADLEHIKVQPVTCGGAGCKEHWRCWSCHRIFLDAACTQETTEEEVEITAGPVVHTEIRHVEARPATCDGYSGYKEYWHCWDCHSYFLDEACTQEVDEYDLEITEPYVHADLHHIDARPATYECSGCKEHWECYACDRYYWDEACTQEAYEDEIIIMYDDSKEDILAGDINEDGEFDIVDVVMLIEILNGRAADTNGAADVDGSGDVNINDVKALIEKIFAAEEKTTFDIVLKNAGPTKLAVVKAAKDALGLGLKETKDLVDSAPCVLKEGVDKATAEAVKAALEERGAEVEIK